MKFNCGLTRSEKFQKKLEWHPWFAWYPVRIDGTKTCVWLETVSRKISLFLDTTVFSYVYKILK